MQVFISPQLSRCGRRTWRLWRPSATWLQYWECFRPILPTQESKTSEPSPTSPWWWKRSLQSGKQPIGQLAQSFPIGFSIFLNIILKNGLLEMSWWPCSTQVFKLRSEDTQARVSAENLKEYKLLGLLKLMLTLDINETCNSDFNLLPLAFNLAF